MLAPTVKNGRVCAWLRSRRASKSAALLTRLALRGLGMVSDEGRPDTSTRARRAASNEGHGSGNRCFRTERPPIRQEHFE